MNDRTKLGLEILGLGLILGLILAIKGGIPMLERKLEARTDVTELRLQQLNYTFQVRADALLAHRLGITGF